ncbi:MAG: hypothetical protein CFE37_06110 [Alphaproteobacteria bacterium PA4]|nr:MAG: hypothetical protein CFE37_06110 [Alphaproteobacteria bacterium PA4]
MPLSPEIIAAIVPVGAVAIITSTIGWVAVTWLKIRNGYPLENSWGKPLLPAASNETIERVKLLAQENAQLRAEMGSMKDRLQVLERIAVDKGSRLAAEIDSLGTPRLN